MDDNLPDFNHSFLASLNEAFAAHSGRICCQMGDRSITYAEVDRLSAQVANQLIEAGLQAGDTAAVFALNSPEALLATLGIIRAGGVWVPVNPRNAMGENLKILRRFGVAYLFFQQAFAEATEPVSQQSGALCVAFDESFDGFVHWDAWVSAGADRAPSPDVTADSLLSIPQTGGTTGEPKGVMLTHRAFCANAYSMATLNDRADQVWLCAAPMTHVGGRIALCVMPGGARLVILDRVDLTLVLETIERERVTDLFLPPTAIYALLDHPRLDEFDLSSLKQLGYGSAPMSTERLREALRRIGPVMCGGFGQTECPMSISSLRPEQHFVDGAIAPEERLRTVGRETPVSKVRIMGDDGQILGTGEVGEIVVKGPTVCAGYYENPEATAEIRRNGWHLTGDIGYLDADGFLTICDRKKDMIITGGFNVYSAEVEHCLAALEGIAQVSVVGVPDEKWGELVTAAVITENGVDLDITAVTEVAREQLGGVKTPKRIEVVDAFPLTSLGKVDKKALRLELSK